MRIMVLGVSGMLGNAAYRVLSANPDLSVFGTARSEGSRKFFSEAQAEKIILGVDVENQDSLIKAFGTIRPDVVINCVGLVKQLADANDPLQAVPINTLLPHRLAALCKAAGARLVHISTDCVFSGEKGGYLESDFPDAYDLYGRSKLLGEVDYPHAITLRTSIIGRELSGHRSLVGWFLAQQGAVQGFKGAIFSGLPTMELARVINEYVLPRPDLHGLYHVAAKPINKYDLLKLVAKTYGKETEIVPSDRLTIDRSLNADRFREATGYVAPEWPVLVQNMHDFN
ncbi:dTDP-4-dehydrorhamnose reductase family protein [Pseudomonas chlororaphis]|uniref:dTDP-4-dehydrorhamnose reductase family protein n=1 Tax=Pseudomonas chlororaphis TaxID=587753 RepID=UPI000F57ACD3|nr:SDR family oxidoreductase [Pseudomonas chlororaphis]AZD81017.1 putative dTDP-4-dehydrorhamnose reductase [Pseudomonas chlororaphis subsp. aurantiaca]